MFIHFQYGRATFRLRADATSRTFCETLGSYIIIRNRAVNKFDFELSLGRKLKGLLAVDEDHDYFDMVLDRIVVFPPSEEDLITQIIEKSKNETLLRVSSVESEREGLLGSIACIVNSDEKPAY